MTLSKQAEKRRIQTNAAPKRVIGYLKVQIVEKKLKPI